MKTAISLDSACDLSAELIEKYGFKVIPFGVNLGEDFYYDGEIETQKIFDYVDKTGILPKTSAVNSNAFTYHFQTLLKDYDAVIHFSLSGEMSSAYNNALIASKEFENVYVVDSKSLSTGISLLAIKAFNLLNAGETAENVYKTVSSLTDKVQASFVIERLDYLYKGGRCSSLALLGANILKIRPVIEVLNGKMTSTEKLRGKMEKVVELYCRSTLEKYPDFDNDVLFITHSTATDEMVKSAKDVIKEYGFKNVYETVANCVISSHCGKNTLGILYLKK